MAHKVTIECEARFVDHLSDESKRASDSIDDIGTAADKAQKRIDKLGKKKFKPIFDADNNKFLKKIREAEDRAKKLGKTKTTMVLKVIDKATNVIGNALNKAQRFGGSVWSAILKVKDSQAVTALGKVAATAKSFAGRTWSAIVTVKDKASSVINNIKNSLFNLKNIVGTVIAGYAVKQATNTLVSQPVGLADSIESSRIAFESKLGSAEKAESFLQDIYKFDEKSPFDTMEIVGITQQMMNLGWTAENVLDDLGTIGDWSASLGKGEEGISAVTRALGQMRMKGKLSSEEMLQLTEAGVDAWNYLAQYMGKDITEVRELAEDGAIDVNTAITGIMSGMSSYAGSAAALADRTVSGLIDQIKSLFKTYVALPWGEGLSEGFRDALANVRDLIEKNKGSLKKFGETAKEVGLKISSWFAAKVEKALNRITEITNSEAFKKGSLTKKINMLWDGVIANPFSEWWKDTVIPWWDGTAMPWLTEKAKGLGSAIGKGLTGGLLVLLGFNAEDAIMDGATIGGSFMEGFLEGFDTSKITKALSDWVSDNKVLAGVLGAVLAGKLISGIGNVISGWKGIKSMLPGGSDGGAGGTLLSDAYSGTMNVTAGVVNVYGGIKNNASDVVDKAKDTYLTYRALKTGKKAAKLLKAGDTAADGTKLLTGTSSSTKLLTAGSKVDDVADAGKTIKNLYTYTNAAGDAVGSSSRFGAFMGKAGASFAKTFPKLSKGLTKAAPWLSVLDFGIDGVLGYSKAKKEGASTKKALGKGATKALIGEYEENGAGKRTLNAVSNTAKWAGAGALIGSVVPGVGTLIGGGIGAAVGLGSNLIGQGLDTGVLQDAWKSTSDFFTDTIPTEAGKLKESLSGFFTETVPEAWDSFWGGISDFFTGTVPTWWEGLTESVSTFFTETIPEKWNELWDGVSDFFTETIPNAWNTLTEKVSGFFTETLPEKWNSFWDTVNSFLLETVPYALGYATGKVYTFFTETVPEFFGNLWDNISTFFTETLPEWAEGIWNDHIYPFFTETIPQFFGNLWDSIATFFTETLPEWAEGIWNDHVYPFFTETIPQFFSDLWDSIATFFTETLPEWAEGIWNDHVYPFFTETIPQFFSDLWDSIATFFTETLPEWAEGIWENNVVPFFTETIPGFFGSLWDGVCGFFDESIDFIAEQIWAPIRDFFTVTIPGWASGAIEKVKGWWGTVKENFLSGFNAGSGGGDGEGGRARGGIVGGRSSSAEAFARGGRTDGGIIGGSTRFIRVNEESPEMIIPLSSQRRERAMKLWAKTGQLLGVPGFARGGNTAGDQDEGIRFKGYGTSETTGERTVHVEVGGIHIELKVEATDKEGVVQAIKEQLSDIAESVAGIFADEFEALFENTPVRGVVN